MTKLQTFAFYGAALAMLLGVGAYQAFAAPVLPIFNADNFSTPTLIDNPWFSLPVGLKLEYEGETEDGTETVEIEITGDTRAIMGITALVYRDRVFVDDELVEDTRDYLAQDDDGNVWYLGEDVDNYENGRIDNHDGAWLAGKDDAKPGYWLPGNPRVGDEYRQEFSPGEAEDVGEVVSLNATVNNDLDTYTNCLKTKDTSTLEPRVEEFKYYCKKVHTLVLEENPDDDERVELVSIESADAREQRIILLQRIISLLQQYLVLLRG